MEDIRKMAKDLAMDHIENNDPTGWFEKLYSQAGADAGMIPWAEGKVNPSLAEWMGRRVETFKGKSALVVGCGLGDDAEYLSGVGMVVSAFDISSSAVGWCRKRFPQTKVNFFIGDLLDLATAPFARYDFVFEAYTLQALPEKTRNVAKHNLPHLLKAGGTLLVVCQGRDETEPLRSLPWPLLKEELMDLQSEGLQLLQFEDFFDREDPPVRRFRLEYRRV